MGEQRVGAAAAGLDVNFGSVADEADDIMLIGMEDSDTININSLKEVKGHDINAANYTMQARGAKARGKAAMTGAIIGATGTILSGASQIISGWMAGPAPRTGPAGTSGTSFGGGGGGTTSYSSGASLGR